MEDKVETINGQWENQFTLSGLIVYKPRTEEVELGDGTKANRTNFTLEQKIQGSNIGWTKLFSCYTFANKVIEQLENSINQCMVIVNGQLALQTITTINGKKMPRIVLKVTDIRFISESNLLFLEPKAK